MTHNATTISSIFDGVRGAFRQLFLRRRFVGLVRKWHNFLRFPAHSFVGGFPRDHGIKIPSSPQDNDLFCTVRDWAQCSRNETVSGLIWLRWASRYAFGSGNSGDTCGSGLSIAGSSRTNSVHVISLSVLPQAPIRTCAAQERGHVQPFWILSARQHVSHVPGTFYCRISFFLFLPFHSSNWCNLLWEEFCGFLNKVAIVTTHILV